MKFVPKIKLAEEMAANPLDKAVKDNQDITALAQEGILTAAAAETDAINQYSQILDLVNKSEEWLIKLAKSTLEDIIAEEKRHFAQLSMIISKLPAFKKEFAAGKEEVETGKDKDEVKEALDIILSKIQSRLDYLKDMKESVSEKTSEKYTEYDLDRIIRIIVEESNVSESYLYDLADALNLVGVELYPAQVDQLLNQIDFNLDTLDRIEKRIIEEADIKKMQAQEKSDDITSDIDTLKSLLDNKLFSSAAKEEVQKAITALAELTVI